MQHGDKCIEFMADLNVKRLGDLSLIRRARRDALVVRNTVILFPPFSHSFCSIIEKLKVLGLSGHISHIIFQVIAEILSSTRLGRRPG